MEQPETPTPPSGARMSGEEVRRATFPQALRGYDRDAVHDLLDRVADWMEGKGGAVASATPGMREELAKVGERTAGILTAAEEAAQNLRQEAIEYAEKLRGDADDEVRKSRLNASQRMDEMIADAETKAQRIIDDAVARRRQLNQAVSSLLERRDEIAGDAAKLAEELLDAVDRVRASDPRDEPVEPEANEPDPVSAGPEPGPSEPEAFGPVEPMPAELEQKEEPERDSDSDETEIFEPDSDETALLEPDSDEYGTKDELDGPATLLVDPDAEDDTPPRGLPRPR